MEYISWVMRMNGSSGKKPRVHNNLKYYREKLGVTQQEMEWRCDVERNQWSRYEAGEREPKIALAHRFAKVYNDIARRKGIDLQLTINDLYPSRAQN
ncbi:helix-turn-helix transcriptional regulator [Paradesulfitobacterium ferrireducens]|uniref:helix-turn-helix transcriptional regulator n=1 Tax=Paradesulfitobacterium ferrireducens TaxID=2816476 RepID=UPI001A8E1AD6|nr:helix-turn-helix transcriptional regulator [Paradesulfitobacterium ferrireducens]